MNTENYNINDLLKATHVKRWHTVETLRQQTLAEHQWSVTVIAIKLATGLGLSDKELLDVILLALVHDQDEVRTGDIPSPEKERLRLTGAAPSYGGLGDSYIHTDPIAPTTGSASGAARRRVETIVRAADRLDAWWWSQRHVTSPWVRDDCVNRLGKFMDDVDDGLNEAMGFMIEEIMTSEDIQR